MDGKGGLLTFGAYLIAAAMIVLVASVGVMQYSARIVPAPSAIPVARIDDHFDPDPLRAAEVELSKPAESTLEAQRGRIRVMEQMLAEKNKRLREQAEQLKAVSRRVEQLQAQYDEAVSLAMEVLDQTDRPNGESSNEANDAGQPVPDRSKLEAELAMAEAVQKKLLADLEDLQTELAQANQELERLRGAATQRVNGPVDEQLVLETASAEVLVAVGSSAVPSLIKALHHRNPIVRRWAATVLGSIGPDADEAIAALKEALSDSNVEVRNAAQAALESIER